MRIIYDPGHSSHNPPYELYDGVQTPYAECAARASGIAEALRTNARHQMEGANEFGDEVIREVHLNEYVEFVEQRSSEVDDGELLFPSYFIMDTYTPLTSATYQAARGAVNVALTAAQSLAGGDAATLYALCRPPGHHAGPRAMGGYCYFNNAAIASHYLSQHGKVALLDVDFHHGNGSQDIFYERDDVLYVSIHADPRVRFPYSTGFASELGSGRGRGFNRNYPLALGTSDDAYLSALDVTLADVSGFEPAFLVVSLGFDTYRDDPIGGFALGSDVYTTIGERIASLGLPTLLVQEGGYNVEALPGLVQNFLKGLD